MHNFGRSAKKTLLHSFLSTRDKHKESVNNNLLFIPCKFGMHYEHDVTLPSLVAMRIKTKTRKTCCITTIIFIMSHFFM